MLLSGELCGRLRKSDYGTIGIFRRRQAEKRISHSLNELRASLQTLSRKLLPRKTNHQKDFSIAASLKP